MVIVLTSIALDLTVLIASILMILNKKSKFKAIQPERIMHSDEFDDSYRNGAKVFWIFIFIVKLITLYKISNPDFFDVLNLFLLTLLCAIFLLHSYCSSIILLNDEVIRWNYLGVMKKNKYVDLVGAKLNLVENFGKSIVIGNADNYIKIPWHYIDANNTARIIEEKSKSIGQ